MLFMHKDTSWKDFEVQFYSYQPLSLTAIRCIISVRDVSCIGTKVASTPSELSSLGQLFTVGRKENVARI